MQDNNSKHILNLVKTYLATNMIDFLQCQKIQRHVYDGKTKRSSIKRSGRIKLNINITT